VGLGPSGVLGVEARVVGSCCGVDPMVPHGAGSWQDPRAGEPGGANQLLRGPMGQGLVGPAFLLVGYGVE
jgi:hypothetical protein